MSAHSIRKTLLIIVAAVVPALVLGTYIGALAAADNGTASIPAAIVNQDKLIQTKNDDGTTTTTAAGRLVVTALTKPSTRSSGAGIDWTLASASQAKSDLANGSVYAVITIPKNFSKSLTTISGADATKAHVTITTDDAHGYLVGQISSALGTSLTSALGERISKSVIEGLYSGYADLHTGITKAANGGDEIGENTTKLASGLSTLANGQDQIVSGISALGPGATKLASGASQLGTATHSLAGNTRDVASGLRQIAASMNETGTETGQKSLVGGINAYASGTAAAGNGIEQILANDPSINERTRAALKQIAQGLTASKASGAALAGGVTTAFGKYAGALQSTASGVDKLAAGTDTIGTNVTKLASGANQLASGAEQLASGGTKISAGIRESSSGAKKLGDGTTSLATGLHEAADGVPNYSATERSRIASVAAAPVSSSADRENKTSDIGAIVAAFIAPAALWLGALASVLLLGAFRRRLLASGASVLRLVSGTLGRGALIALAQALAITALVQLTVPIPFGAAMLLLLVAAAAGVAFFAVHQFLGAAFGRLGTVISVVLLGVQLVAAGGLYPVELVSSPFQAVSPLLPISAAVTALQAVVTGAYGSAVPVAFAVLALYGLLGFIGSLVALSRRRASAALYSATAGPVLG